MHYVRGEGDVAKTELTRQLGLSISKPRQLGLEVHRHCVEGHRLDDDACLAQLLQHLNCLRSFAYTVMIQV